MSDKINEVYSNSWLSINELINKEKGIDGYYYLHEKRCNGIIVGILPYRFDEEEGIFQFLIRSEFTPCWSTEENKISSITGGFNHETTLDTAKAELKEEAGYDVDKEEFIDLGTCYGTKSSDTVYYLYGINLAGKEASEPTTNDPMENKAYNFWFDGKETDELKLHDPILSMLILRLISELF